MCARVYVCHCTWGLYRHCKRVGTGSWLREKIPLHTRDLNLCLREKSLSAPGTQTCVWEKNPFLHQGLKPVWEKNPFLHQGLKSVWEKKSISTPGTQTCVWEKNPFPHQGLKPVSKRKIPFRTRDSNLCLREKSISTPVSERKIHSHTRDSNLSVLHLASRSDALPTELSPPRQRTFPLPCLRSFVFWCSLSKTPVPPSHSCLLTCAAAVMGVLW